MSKKNKKDIKDLRSMNFTDWSVTMWIVKRKSKGREALYEVLRVDTDDKLQNRLKKSIVDKVINQDYKLEEYSYLSADQDESIFTLETEGTDFIKIKELIQSGFQNNKASTFEDLLDSWVYVVEIGDGQHKVFGVRKINNLAKAKKVMSVSSLIFKDRVLVDLDDEHVFTIDTHLDFFEYQDTIYIVNKKEFESALNFRKGMEDNRDEILTEFEDMELFENVEPIRKVVGNNIHLLRKISLVKNNAYYKDEKFISNLKKACKLEGWDVVFRKGKIVVTEENADLVLTLLNNCRLKSPINQETFDAIVKNKVE